MRRGSLKGFEGRITRVVKISDTKKEYFFGGPEDATFEDALRAEWPFKEHSVKKKWRVLSLTGEDLTQKKLSSHDKTVILEFL